MPNLGELTNVFQTKSWVNTQYYLNTFTTKQKQPEIMILINEYVMYSRDAKIGQQKVAW